MRENKGEIVTYLSHIHPYPAMISDSLATEIAQKYVKPGDRMLDPFCGTGRTLVASAEMGASTIGIDVNPLAVLIAQSKGIKCNVAKLNSFEKKLPTESNGEEPKYEIEQGRFVRWFSAKAKREIGIILDALNRSRLSKRELRILAVVLSATVRESSYCRKDQWKLHRLSKNQRHKFNRSPIAIFRRRIRAVCEEVSMHPGFAGSLRVLRGNVLQLGKLFSKTSVPREYDVVITSPPYGDSRSTVQYGAISALCLGAISNLNSLGLKMVNGHSIDRSCLGGSFKECEDSLSKSYWAGSSDNFAVQRAASYLSDLGLACSQVAKHVRDEGYVIFVIGRRLIGGWRLKSDDFAVKVFKENGFRVEEWDVRRIQNKITPTKIDSNGNVKNAESSKTIRRTMREEAVIVLKKKK